MWTNRGRQCSFTTFRLLCPIIELYFTFHTKLTTCLTWWAWHTPTPEANLWPPNQLAGYHQQCVDSKLQLRNVKKSEITMVLVLWCTSNLPNSIYGIIGATITHYACVGKCRVRVGWYQGLRRSISQVTSLHAQENHPPCRFAKSMENWSHTVINERPKNPIEKRKRNLKKKISNFERRKRKWFSCLKVREEKEKF